MVPHLVTALNGPLLELEKKILAATPAIERWFRLEWQEHTPPFYCAVDLRNSGFKLAPVHTSLFPDSFHNLSAEMLPLAVQAAMAAIDKYCPDAKNLMMIPGAEINNPEYRQNLARLMQIFRQTGLHIRLGSLSDAIREPTPIELADGNMLVLEPLVRTHNGRRLGLKNFEPCTVLFNNDLPNGVLPIIDNLNEQSVLPPLHAGRTTRRLTNHFNAYDEVAKKFGKLIDADPWTLNPLHIKCAEVNFLCDASIATFASTVDTLMAKIRKKYREYGVKEKPFVVIKPDGVAPDFGITPVKDSNEAREFCRRNRERALVRLGIDSAYAQAQLELAATRAAQKAERAAERARLHAEAVAAAAEAGLPPLPPLQPEPDLVPAPDEDTLARRGEKVDIMLQEGVHTFERINDTVAEPVVYMIDRYVVGGFYRVHRERGFDQNLNIPGAQYVPLAFAQQHMPDVHAKPGSASPNRFYMYGVVARLALLAASLEMERTDPNPEVY